MERQVLGIVSIALSSFSLGIALCNILHLLFGSVRKPSDFQSESRDQKACKGMGFKEARLAAGLTVQQVVKALKVSDASVYLWETGQMYPKTARLHEIADLYGCTVDELLKPRKEEK